jgi:hypothetical protein
LLQERVQNEPAATATAISQFEQLKAEGAQLAKELEPNDVSTKWFDHLNARTLNEGNIQKGIQLLRDEKARLIEDVDHLARQLNGVAEDVYKKDKAAGFRKRSLVKWKTDIEERLSLRKETEAVEDAFIRIFPEAKKAILQRREAIAQAWKRGKDDDGTVMDEAWFQKRLEQTRSDLAEAPEKKLSQLEAENNLEVHKAWIVGFSEDADILNKVQKAKTLNDFLNIEKKLLTV